ncbi:hypothetical protein [Trichocoleus sp. FACHB-591]|nr:hypothetical protein [Trichocoleus sp. FACHB-591]
MRSKIGVPAGDRDSLTSAIPTPPMVFAWTLTLLMLVEGALQ